ncbi:sulfite exporter TauE/SafE family protein [Chamaesiphon sp. OTE_75_metabat_556]|uniref:sulfite exporter TauE/SafE family protein n=1 Tax=Chamaesiphon sp. OTE_75_metabat_556 TaxID=2964692 RepID=UPI00286BB88D|nr:sulfite exporter TauE/SafE family protein [Chamaesiphon sp. OTE_75_metabat_556]
MPIAPPLTDLNGLLLFATAFIAGGLNAVAGGGSFISFPTLIFTGMSPIAANATNNTALWVASLASAGAYRRDLDVDSPEERLRQRRTMLILSTVSLVGGLLGSILLLYTSADIFKKLIPYLLLLATIVFIFGESFKQWLKSFVGEASPSENRANAPKSIPLAYLVIAQLIIAIYGGFFGAGIGILMLASLTFFNIRNIHAMNALKTWLGTCINGIAIVPFLFAGIIAWQQTIIMAISGALGGYFIANFARQIPSQIIRRFVSIVAIFMTTYFFIHG